MRTSSLKNGVPGEGPTQAEIMLIGEGPGFHENEQDRPFVSAAGKFLDQCSNRPPQPAPTSGSRMWQRRPPEK
jgi:uracil-DNA glycosylase family 4